MQYTFELCVQERKRKIERKKKEERKEKEIKKRRYKTDKIKVFALDFLDFEEE